MSLLQTLNNFLLKIEDINSPYNMVTENRPEIKDITNDVCKKLLLLRHLLSTSSNNNIEMNRNIKNLLLSDFVYDDSNSVISKNSTISSFDDNSNHEINSQNFDSISFGKHFLSKFKVHKTDTLRSIGSSSGFSDGEEDGEFEFETCKIIFNEAMKAYNDDCYAKCVRLIENNQIKKINLDLFILCSKAYKKMILDSESSEEYNKLSIYWLDFIEKVEINNSYTSYELHFLNIKNDCLWKCITNNTINISLFIKFSTKLFKTNWNIFEIVTKNPDCKSFDFLTLINNLISILRYCIDEGLEKEENDIEKINKLSKNKTGLLLNTEKQNIHLFPIVRLEILNVKNCLKTYLGNKNEDKSYPLNNDKEKLLFQKISGKLREIEEDFVRKSMTQKSHLTNHSDEKNISKANVIMRYKNNNERRKDIKSTPSEIINTKILSNHEKRISSSSNESGKHFLKLTIEPEKGISLIKDEETNNKSIILRF